MPTQLAYIGLGSNQQQPYQQLQNALYALEQLPETQILRISSPYLSDSLLPGQPRYCNAVAVVETTLPPLALLDHLQAVENAQGRTRTEHWGPRTLDLDILLYGDEIINQPRLRIPHDQMLLRPFVLYPLAEIAPDLTLPDGQPLTTRLSTCPQGNLQKLANQSFQRPRST